MKLDEQASELVNHMNGNHEVQCGPWVIVLQSKHRLPKNLFARSRGSPELTMQNQALLMCKRLPNALETPVKQLVDVFREEAMPNATMRVRDRWVYLIAVAYRDPLYWFVGELPKV